MRIESAARSAYRVALTVQNDNGRKLAALAAKTLERGLARIAQYDDRLGVAAGVRGVARGADAHPVNPDVLSLDPFGERFKCLQTLAALRILRAAEHQHDHFSAQARKADRLPIGSSEAEILRASRHCG